MKVKVPLLALLLLAGAIGYLLGTESGRQRRDQLMARLNNEEAMERLAGKVEQAVEDVADMVATDAESATN